MKPSREYIGINIQYPISKLILDGKKTIETRTYPLPKAYIGQELALVETPGRSGDFKARIMALITFGESFEYKNAASFYRDQKRHHVSPDSPWRWVQGKNKWGWPILKIKPFKQPKPAPLKKGIRYTHGIPI